MDIVCQRQASCFFQQSVFATFILILVSGLSFSDSSHALNLPLSENPLKVIIVHSYHKGFEWTDSLENGFVSTLSKLKKVDVIKSIYLDAKKSPEYILKNSLIALKKIKSSKFDILFVTDDDALKHVGVKYFNTDKIVIFAGINHSLSMYGIGAKGSSDLSQSLPGNVAGVLEYYPISPLLGLIKKILPKTANLNLYFDDSETSKAVWSRFQSEFSQEDAKQFGLKIGSMIFSNSLQVWEKSINRSNPEKDVNLIFPFSNVRDNFKSKKSLASGEIAKWITAKSKTPEFATASITMKFPFFATVGIRGNEHGEDAAMETIKLLRGISNHKVAVGRYARLNINNERAKELQVLVPFEILAYSYSLQKSEFK